MAFLSRNSSGRTFVSSGLIVTLACGGGFELAGSPVPPPPLPPSPPPSVTSVLLKPDSIELSPRGQQQFSATAQYSDGTAAAIPVSWSADGGTISAAGWYAADSIPGRYVVVATDSVSGRADTSTVIITQAVLPGQYATIAKEDWSTYADKDALLGRFGVEGQLNRVEPALPVTDFYDLVPDPIFGKVVRYNGGPQFNIAKRSMPGRVAIHGVGLGGERTHVWVRQFIRFSRNWTTTSATGGSGAADYKAMFLRYANSSARHQVKLGTNARGLEHSGGNPGLTLVNHGLLPWHNVVDINTQYHTIGWPVIDFFPFVKAPGPYPSAPSPNAPYGDGNGEWVEIVMHHKTVGERGEFTVYWRQYTVSGVVSPQAWKIHAGWKEAQVGQVFPGVTVYTMGVNRNRQYDEPMFIYWGPFEIVDGSQYPNPWSLPGG